MAGAPDRQGPSVGSLAGGWNRDRRLAGQVGAGEARLRAGQVGERPLGNDLAPLDPRPGSEIHQPVGRAHRVLVVFDDDHRVAHVAQPLQGGDQAVVVAGMQADRGLVEDVEHAHQPGPDLARQANSLGLAAGERRRRAVERQVVQAHVGQEPESPTDLLQQLVGDGARDRIEGNEIRGFAIASRGRRLGQGVEESGGAADGHGAKLDERLAAHAHGPGAGVEPATPALGAGHAAHVRLELGPGGAAGRLAIAGQELGGHPLPLLGVRPDPPPVLPVVHDHPLAGAVKPDVAEPLVELAPGPLEHRSLGGTVRVGLEVGRDPLEQMPPPLAHILDRPNRSESAVPDREVGIGNQQVRVEVVPHAQAIAGQAHALRTVETEELRAGRVEAQAAEGAGVMR